ncbi:hypothetical protein MKJ04_00055 [Pontibacter sp. E15-1]|uniref:glycosyltransferase family 2 protein n=1 Tax=Pontibacter sp. E15-1 TaxID=2919918 RepID=UPI001F4F7853|nr:hypothetical protein [Pontibacter sp. E15-1]MCJ8163213.1 hypothetical protein [Pontibacter sp. E15-1]
MDESAVGSAITGMKISVIVPLHESVGYAQALLQAVRNNSSPAHIKEVIFVGASENLPLQQLEETGKVRVLVFAGAGHRACLEAGAFEAKGDVLFFVAPGTFPEKGFDTAILTTIHQRQAGIVRRSLATGWVQWLTSVLPLRCLLCFIKTDNFFSTRWLFHHKSKRVPRRQTVSFTQLMHQYAIAFGAQVV